MEDTEDTEVSIGIQAEAPGEGSDTVGIQTHHKAKLGVARAYFMGIPGNVKQCIDTKNGATARKTEKTEKTGYFMAKIGCQGL